MEMDKTPGANRIVALTDSALTLGRHMARNHDRHSARLGGLSLPRSKRGLVERQARQGEILPM